MWWKEAGIFVFPEDIDWIMTAGGYLWHVDHVSEVGKYNPGQKMFFLTVAFFGVIMLGTGLIMWFPGIIPTEFVRWLYPLHIVEFVIIFSLFFVHLYLGIIGSPGSASAMISGWVTRAWVKKQHPKWFAEMEHEGTLIVSEGKK